MEFNKVLLDLLFSKEENVNLRTERILSITIDNITYENLLLIEQNKNKSSIYAQIARDGERIAWLIDDSSIFKYIALVTDQGIYKCL